MTTKLTEEEKSKVLDDAAGEYVEEPELTPEEKIQKSLPAFDLMTEEGKDLIRTSLKRMEWVLTFMAFNDQFNFEILSRMHKVPSLAIETMGVRPAGFNITLMYNPVFVSKLTDEELRYVLGHEVLHVVLHHITKRAPNDPSEHQLHNYGADLAINSLQPSGTGRSYPTHKEDKKDKSGKVIAKKGTPWILLPKLYGFEEKQSMDQYILLLQDKYKDHCPQCGKKHKPKKEKGDQEEDQNGQPQPQPGDKEEGDGGEGDQEGQGEGEGDQEGKGKGKGKGKGTEPGEGAGAGEGEEDGEGEDGCECDGNGVGSFDDHSGWDKSPLADSQVREWVKGVDAKKAWGTVSAEIQEMIRSAQKAEVNWVGQLRHYYGQISTSSTRSTYKRPSRRMWYPWTGRVRETVDKKLVGIDDSGSVSSKMLEKFLAETNKLAQIQPVDVLTWDAGLTMTRAIPWERRKLTFSFQGRGGTDPQPCLDYAKEHGYKECVMLTDGYFGAVTKPAGLNVLWVITPDGTTDNLPFGKVIKMVNMPN